MDYFLYGLLKYHLQFASLSKRRGEILDSLITPESKNSSNLSSLTVHLILYRMNRWGLHSPDTLECFLLGYVY